MSTITSSMDPTNNWPQWLIGWLKGIFTFASITLLGFGGFLYSYQTRLLYPSNFPPDSRTQVDLPTKWAMDDYEDVYLKSKDGTRLHSFLIWRKLKKFDNHVDYSDKTVLFLHANAGNMGHRLPFAKIFHEKFNCNIFMLSYRGYGLSEGEAEETGIKQDAEAAFKYIKNHPRLKNTKILVYGQSIGAAIAIDLTCKFQAQIDALVIENTFLSIPKILPHVFPILKHLTFLCTQIWDSEKSIQKIEKLPILFLSGKKDELVPPQHMLTLYQTLFTKRQEQQTTTISNEKKTVPGNTKVLEFKPKTENTLKMHWAEFPDGTHNDTCMQSGYFEEIEKFSRLYF